MEFLKNGSLGEGNVGTYVFTIAAALLSLVIGQFFIEFLAVQFLGFSLLSVPNGADLNVILSLVLIPFAFVLISLLLCIKYLHKRSILSIFTSRSYFDWKRFFVSFGLWGGVLILTLIVSLLFGEPIQWNLKLSSFIPLLLISIFLIPIQTTAEEVLFRGYLFQGFGVAFKKGWIAILLSGILFGLMHGANPEVALLGQLLILYYISTGVFLGILAHMDDGLELGMGYHSVNNIFASLIVTNNWQAFHTEAMFIDTAEPSFGLEALITPLLLQPLLIFVFSKLYSWKNWRQKLLQ